MELGVGELVGVGKGGFAVGMALTAIPESGIAGRGTRTDVGDNDNDFERVRLATAAAAACSASLTRRSSRCRSRCKTAIARS